MIIRFMRPGVLAACLMAVALSAKGVPIRFFLLHIVGTLVLSCCLTFLIFKRAYR